MRDENGNMNHSSVLIQIDVQNLKIGMYVAELDRPWLETNFLFQGFVLKTESDVLEVQKQCDFVYIDVAKQRKYKTDTGKAKNTAYTKGWIENARAPKKKSSFTEEYSQAEVVHHNTRRVVKNFMEDVALGRAINVELAKKAVSECVSSIVNSPDALMWLTQLKNKDEYTSQHSMNVCVFSIALGRQLGLPEVELEEIGLCGMMHDMGKMKVPLHILNKPGKFEPEELAIMRSHTTLGWKLLLSTSNMPSSVIDVAYGHHERLDGKGYPRSLIDQNIPLYTRIVTVADVYDAISSDRVYKKGKTHLEAINIMTNISGTELDAALVVKFIESLGVYPPGNIVEMSNGEVAIVVENNPEKKLKPKITMLLDELKESVKPRLVDLAKMDLDARGQPYAIRRIARPEEYKIDMNKLYELKLIEKTLANM